MKKPLAALGLACAFLLPSAHAASNGWYTLSAAWDGGVFSGQFYYDSGSPYQITQINGTLVDDFQTTAITKVWNILNAADPGDPLFLQNAKASAAFGYDAGFYFAVQDLGATLAVDTSKDNSLYDWSDDTRFTNGELNGVALQSWTISPVPEPATWAMLGLGLLGCAAMRRRHR